MKTVYISTLIIYFLIGCDSQKTKEFKNTVNEADKTIELEKTNKTNDSLTHIQIVEEIEPLEEEPIQVIPTLKLEFSERPSPKTIAWKKVGTGLQYAEIDLPMKCNVGDSRLSVLKINPDSATTNLASSKFAGKVGFRANEWMDSFGYKAVINAGMFNLDDYMTCTGYMVVDDKTNNPNLNKQYNVIAAFKPKTAGVPNFKIIDLRCENWEDWKDKYHSYAQGIRVADCNGLNKWSKQEKFWSMVLLGEDKNGNALFLFSRTPYRVHDLSKMILALPLNIENIMYLEGGPEASFRLKTKNINVSKMGSYETGFNPLDNNKEFWSIPNVIYVK